MEEIALTQTAQKVLLFLLKKDGVPAKVLVEEGGVNNTPLIRALQELEQLGLVTEKREENVIPRRRLIFLTEKGKKVAEKLREINEIIKA
ncbi:winged helix-turn-helix transcriptional regulator [Saccharolobus shibatae]|uniref:Transcriptional regulator, wHTH n=1 Tax=Saccharolobus shibatae TaxID=2286 RepID=A0A8F5BS34_9CREN|nr:winged helix-turn-helix transcriptional regulator [Saccharolobus shibatae]QXJ30323.1 Transcriptional regulator, wHTH [Saccharolobus shibatae]QXJ30425.1 Transcriptional regulator, wHTH [Saccharolobus shibatae]